MNANSVTDPERRPITMSGIIALALVVIVALIILGFVLHLLFSPWLLVGAIAVLAWIKLRPRRSQPVAGRDSARRLTVELARRPPPPWRHDADSDQGAGPPEPGLLAAVVGEHDQQYRGWRVRGRAAAAGRHHHARPAAGLGGDRRDLPALAAALPAGRRRGRPVRPGHADVAGPGGAGGRRRRDRGSRRRSTRRTSRCSPQAACCWAAPRSSSATPPSRSCPPWSRPNSCRRPTAASRSA